jgi:ribosomal protein L29
MVRMATDHATELAELRAELAELRARMARLTEGEA